MIPHSLNGLYPAGSCRLAHECGLKDELDGAWVVWPLEFVREGGQPCWCSRMAASHSSCCSACP
jgi:hypothetical protein